MLVQPDAPLHPHLVDSFNASRLVHNNVVNVGTAEEATASLSGTSTPAPVVDDDKEDKEDELPDTDERSIANTRDPVPGDGIRTLDEMLALGRELLPSGARSAYGHSGGVADETFASRGGFPEGVMGAGGNEPAYTCFTPKFHLTLGRCWRDD
jgi:RNA exonuclease NGL2